LIGAALAVLSACGGPQVPPAQNYGTVVGRAYDTTTNQPVAGVLVAVDTILTATTGSDGTYRIGNIPLGTYRVSVQAPQGYNAPDQPAYNGSITAGQTITVDVPLTH
jgi:hypothetical protein